VNSRQKQRLTPVSELTHLRSGSSGKSILRDQKLAPARIRTPAPHLAAPRAAQVLYDPLVHSADSLDVGTSLPKNCRLCSPSHSQCHSRLKQYVWAAVEGVERRLRACLFGLLVAFHNKQGKQTKWIGFALGFSKAILRNRHAREST
jgi:hypothetical protein